MDFLRERSSRLFTASRRGHNDDENNNVHDDDRYHTTYFYGDDYGVMTPTEGGRKRSYHHNKNNYEDDDDDDEEEYKQFVQADHEYNQMNRHKAEEVERAISNAIGVAERSHGSLLYFQTTSKEGAIGMGRRVSSLRSLEDFQQQQVNVDVGGGGGGVNNNSTGTGQHHRILGMEEIVRGGNGNGNNVVDNDAVSLTASITSLQSKESLPTFLKVPKMNPAMVRMNSWESLARKDHDDDDDVPPNFSTNGGSTMNHPQQQQQPEESLRIVGDYTHRSWAKLRAEEAAKKKMMKKKKKGRGNVMNRRLGRSRSNNKGMQYDNDEQQQEQVQATTKSSDRRRFGTGIGGSMKLLRNASRRKGTTTPSSSSMSRSKASHGGPIDLDDSVNGNDSETTSPEDVVEEEQLGNRALGNAGTAAASGNPAAETSNYDDRFEQPPMGGGGLERQDSWWSGIDFNTGDEEEEEIRKVYPPASSKTRQHTRQRRRQSRRSATPVSPVVATPDVESERPRDVSFEAREVSVEVSLQEDDYLANRNSTKDSFSRSWTRSFRRKKNKSRSSMVKTSPADQEPVHDYTKDENGTGHPPPFESNQTRYQPNANNYFTRDDSIVDTYNPADDEDSIAVSDRRRGTAQPGCHGGNNHIVEVLTLGDAFVDWTLQACEPDESNNPAACFPMPEPSSRKDALVAEQEEFEILCGDTQCLDSNGVKVSAF